MKRITLDLVNSQAFMGRKKENQVEDLTFYPIR